MVSFILILGGVLGTAVFFHSRESHDDYLPRWFGRVESSLRSESCGFMTHPLSPFRKPCPGVSTKKVLKKVHALEGEAERGREELVDCLKKEEARERRAFETARSASLLESLKRDRSALEVCSRSLFVCWAGGVSGVIALQLRRNERRLSTITIHEDVVPRLEQNAS